MSTPLSPDQALNELVAGNRRFATGDSVHPHADPARRADLAGGQHPFAVVVGCSDSRVPPETVFDVGLGDLFVVRAAGHVVDEMALGSIEYAVDHLQAPLVVVLGHKRCGAVSAAVQGGHAHGHLAQLLRAIEPAVQRTRDVSGDRVDLAVRANTELAVERIHTSSVVAGAIHHGKVRVVGAYYDLDSGVVTF